MGIFDKFKAGLAKTRELFSSQLQSLKLQLGAFDHEQLEELEYAFIQSDMGAENVDALISNLKAAMTAQGDVSPDFIRSNLKAQLADILGKVPDIQLANDNLNIFLMIGVNGAGKTTSCGKLAYQFVNEGKQVLICAADTFRAAAIEQLEVWAAQAGARFICQKEGSDPAAVVYDAIQSSKSKQVDLLIVDTAGRLQNKKNLMAELEKIGRIIKREAPQAKVFTFLVIDAANGQNALSQAVSFSEACPLDGFIITKLDGSAKGGIAVAVSKLGIAPIVYAGVGEGITDLIKFSPDDFVEALLPTTAGEGDGNIKDEIYADSQPDENYVAALSFVSEAPSVLPEADGIEFASGYEPASCEQSESEAVSVPAEVRSTSEPAEVGDNRNTSDVSGTTGDKVSDSPINTACEETRSEDGTLYSSENDMQTPVDAASEDDRQLNKPPVDEDKTADKGNKVMNWFNKWFKQ